MAYFHSEKDTSHPRYRNKDEVEVQSSIYLIKDLEFQIKHMKTPGKLIPSQCNGFCDRAEQRYNRPSTVSLSG